MIAKQKAYQEEQKKLEAEELRERIRIQKEMEAKLTTQFRTASLQQNVVRIFQVSNFGIYNSDCPNSLPEGPTIHASFASTDNSKLRPDNMYLIEHGRNQIFSLQSSKFSCSPNRDYSICIIANGQLFLCSKEDFKSTLVQKQKTFVMKPLPDHVSDVAGLRKALEI
jgi:hypothetical protein